MTSMDGIRPRRPHHKSRTGCLQCKSRKVKCDERKPSCQKCRSYGSECSYLQTHPTKCLQSYDNTPGTTIRGSSNSPTPSVLPPRIQLSPSSTSSTCSSGNSGSFSTLDLELLHFWTMHSATEFINFPTGQELFRTTVVELAFDYPFLMHQLMALAALHLSRLRPYKSAGYLLASSTHLNTAMHLFQSEISNLSSENCHAVYAFTTTMFVFAWTPQENYTPVHPFLPPGSFHSDRDSNSPRFQWLHLQRVTQTLLSSQHQPLSNGPMKVIFDSWHKISSLDYIPALDPADDFHLSALASAWSESSPSVLSQSSRRLLDHALAMLRRSFGLLYSHGELDPLSIAMSWFGTIGEDVENMLVEGTSIRGPNGRNSNGTSLSSTLSNAGRTPSPGLPCLPKPKTKEALLLLTYYCVLLHKLPDVEFMRGKAASVLKTMLEELGPGWEKWTSWPMEVVLGRGPGRMMFSRSPELPLAALARTPEMLPDCASIVLPPLRGGNAMSMAFLNSSGAR